MTANPLDLPGEALKLWLILSKHAKNTDVAQASVDQVAELLGCSVATARRHLSRLQTNGWVHRPRGSDQIKLLHRGAIELVTSNPKPPQSVELLAQVTPEMFESLQRQIESLADMVAATDERAKDAEERARIAQEHIDKLTKAKKTKKKTTKKTPSSKKSTKKKITKKSTRSKKKTKKVTKAPPPKPKEPVKTARERTPDMFQALQESNPFSVHKDKIRIAYYKARSMNHAESPFVEVYDLAQLCDLPNHSITSIIRVMAEEGTAKLTGTNLVVLPPQRRAFAIDYRGDKFSLVQIIDE